jgi:hypothetical protein
VLDVQQQGNPDAEERDDGAAVTTPLCSEFVEREARKLCFAHSGWRPDTVVAVPLAGELLPVGPMGLPVVEHARLVPAWTLYIPWVRSVLEGLKEPTEYMITRAQEFTSDDALGYRQVERVCGAVAAAALAVPPQPEKDAA